MLLSLTMVDPQEGYRCFFVWFEPLELGFDVVNALLRAGHQIVSAIILDANHCLPLPIAAFDGIPCIGTIQQLEREWRHLLSQPANP